MISWRYLVAGALVWFAWQGSVMEFDWPFDVPANVEATVEKPRAEVIEWVKAVDPDKILPDDRAYYSSFYSALAFILQRDGTLNPPVITSNDKFADLHAGSLDFAIDQEQVGRYPGLDVQIEEVFAAAAGEKPDISSMTTELRKDLVDACNGLAWRFWINGEE